MTRILSWARNKIFYSSWNKRQPELHLPFCAFCPEGWSHTEVCPGRCVHNISVPDHKLELRILLRVWRSWWQICSTFALEWDFTIIILTAKKSTMSFRGRHCILWYLLWKYPWGILKSYEYFLFWGSDKNITLWKIYIVMKPAIIS